MIKGNTLKIGKNRINLFILWNRYIDLIPAIYVFKKDDPNYSQDIIFECYIHWLFISIHFNKRKKR